MKIAALERKPKIRPHLLEVWSIFMRLHRARPSGYGVSGIPVSEVATAFELCGIWDFEVRLEYAEFIYSLDARWIELSQNKSDKPKSTPTPRPGS